MEFFAKLQNDKTGNFIKKSSVLNKYSHVFKMIRDNVSHDDYELFKDLLKKMNYENLDYAACSSSSQKSLGSKPYYNGGNNYKQKPKKFNPKNNQHNSNRFKGNKHFSSNNKYNHQRNMSEQQNEEHRVHHYQFNNQGSYRNNSQRQRQEHRTHYQQPYRNYQQHHNNNLPLVTHNSPIITYVDDE